MLRRLLGFLQHFFQAAVGDHTGVGAIPGCPRLADANIFGGMITAERSVIDHSPLRQFSLSKCCLSAHYGGTLTLSSRAVRSPLVRRSVAVIHASAAAGSR